MDDHDRVHFAAIAAIFFILQRRRRSRSCWVKPWLMLRERQGLFYNLVTEFCLQDAENFRGILRLDVNPFEHLLMKVAPIIEKKTRKPITHGQRLSVTLRFLATGENTCFTLFLIGVPVKLAFTSYCIYARHRPMCQLACLQPPWSKRTRWASPLALHLAAKSQGGHVTTRQALTGWKNQNIADNHRRTGYTGGKCLTNLD